MQSPKQILVFLFSLSIFSSTIFSAERDYSGEKYCHLHQEQNDRLNLVAEYLSLIPSYNYQCQDVICSQCQNAYPFEYGFYDDDTGEEWTEWDWKCSCKDNFLKNKDRQGYRNFWDYWMPTWKRCPSKAIYHGYLSRNHSRYFSFFHEYLQYLSANQSCTCLWPELSEKASTINKTAYLLFKDIFKTTDLNQLVNDNIAQKQFFLTPPSSGFNLHGTTLNCVCQSFFYSDYEWICRDLELHSESNFSKNSILQIRDKLDDIREVLAALYLDLYADCLKKHSHERIEDELVLVKDCLNISPFLEFHELPDLKQQKNISDSFHVIELETIREERAIKKKNKKPKYFGQTESFLEDWSDYMSLADRPTNWMKSDLALVKGTFLNGLLLYKEAITTLTLAIQLNPSNKNAYIERATAYFETNQLILALRDYAAAKKIVNPPFLAENIQIKTLDIYLPQNKIQFGQGLLMGLKNGSKVAFVEAIPSTLSCCRGLLHGLWWMACTSPTEVDETIINIAYDLGEFISVHSTRECLECVVPELKELCLSWDCLNDSDRGEKIGYIFGKYGLDIFIFGGAAKALKKLTALKRANTMFTLENCAASQAKQIPIIKESTKHANFRAKISDAASKGKILIKNSNTIHHIMQPKHAWDKLIKLTGNIENDFKQVVALLEEHKIYSIEYSIGEVQLSNGIIRKDHVKTILNQKIKVIFNEYTETGEFFLKDGWVITK